MDVNQWKEWVAAGELAAVEKAWMAAADGDGPIPPAEAGEALAALVAAGHEDQAEALGWAMLEERKDRMAPAGRLELAKAMAAAVLLSGELRQQALGLYRELFGSHPHFEVLVKASELLNAPTPRRAFATLDLCLRIGEGAYLANRFRNQVVQVRSFDPILGEYALEDLADGALALDARRLADEFDAIAETDFRILSRRDPGQLAELLQADPAAVLVGICQSRDGRIDAGELKELLVGRYLPADKWSGWWNRARTAVKRCHNLALEGRNPVVVVYHSRGLTLEEELAEDVDAARTPLELLELLRRYGREAKQRKREMDAAFAGNLVSRLADAARSYLTSRPADALAASLALGEAAALGAPPPAQPYPSPREALAAASEPARAVAALGDESLWPAALEALAGLAEGPRHLEEMLHLAPARRLDGVVELLRKAGREEALTAAAARAIADPVGNLELLVWLWGGPAVPVPAAAGRPEILSRMLQALVDLDIDAQAARGGNRKELQRRIRSAIAARDYAGYRQVVAGLDETMADILKRKVERTDGLAESVRDDMLKILRESFFALFAKAKIEPWLDERVVWTTEAALHRYEAELKNLVEVQIPANSRAIGEAAAHGDLSENSEWKYAIEERNKLQQRQAKMQDDLAKARVINRDEVPTDFVGIGSRVTLRRQADGARFDLSILGLWDTDLPRHRYSYQTALAQALLGEAPGETVTLKLEGDETDYRVESIGVADL